MRANQPQLERADNAFFGLRSSKRSGGGLRLRFERGAEKDERQGSEETRQGAGRNYRLSSVGASRQTGAQDAAGLAVVEAAHGFDRK
jgi:hypothetical protein